MILLLQLIFAATLGLITALMYSVYQLPSEIKDLPIWPGVNTSVSFDVLLVWM
jgi:hypothetical protein